MPISSKFSWSEIAVLEKNWRNFAEENFGEYKTINVSSYTNESGLFKFEMKIPFSNGQISFLTTEFKPLKISYLFDKFNPNEFIIYPEDFTDRIGKLFGLKEIETGDTEFDRKFIIKSNNEIFLRAILSFEIKKFLTDNFIANFKLEKTDSSSTLEMNAAINELEMTSIKNILKLFKECITISNRENYLA